jgi:EAL domain-containing protein (putative c-di-GMP-specific phosphodiesterase class I)
MKAAQKISDNKSVLGPLSETLQEIAQNEEKYPAERLLQSLLNAARQRLSMDVAFISEFTDGKRMFRYVSSKPNLKLIKAGEGGPLSESYCLRVVQGRLPELIQDAQQNAEAQTLSITREIPVGAHVSVPIRLSDGTVYGTFCAFSRNNNETLDARDLSFLRVLADISSVYLEYHLQLHAPDQQQRTMLQNIVDRHLVHTLFQPIVRLRDGRAVGYEALTRTLTAQVPPDKLFKMAIDYGLNDALSEMAINTVFEFSALLPEDTYISINAGPDELLNGLVEKLFRMEKNPSRYVLEITEHAMVSDYQELMASLNQLRSLGVRIAVDDAGAGYASFRHILLLKPDIIKLDMSLVRDIHQDKDKQDLVAALMEFSRRRRTALVAEGLETHEELNQLLKLGVEYVQGYLLSHPCDAVELASKSFQQYTRSNTKYAKGGARQGRTGTSS